MAPPPVMHDMRLFDALSAKARAICPGVRIGKMFGCPAVYRGRRLAVCVFGEAVGLKVPADLAAQARESGRAVFFTPYGKRPMREWIGVTAAPEALGTIDDLIAAAIAYAAAGHD